MPENEFAQLLESARRVCMSPEDKERQRRSFAYGNANIENASVTRAVVDKAAEELARQLPNK
jgi:hypothetical protein